MSLSPVGQDGVGTGRLAFCASLSYLRHDFVPRRIYLVGDGYQQGICLSASQHLEALSLFYAVEQGAGLLV